ncbi:MAG TPA: CGNR zinc finger domain-containing protein [Solirubrobacteraceae bacterium]|nr:CGNR zinc finger domain-containing protein [Solirubrobacteraceae bacterium]
MSAVPSWFPASETKPAPMPLLVVQAFVNTLDLEDGTDLLGDPRTARDWLVDARLLDPAARPSASGLELAREMRESLRRLLRRDGHAVGGIDDVELTPLRKVAATRRARLTVGEGGAIELENARNQDLGDALFQLLLIVHGAQEDGTWERLKVCANDECQWAFFDRSRNQQGNWCDMAVCGNRLKNRQLRARRR